jgi:hypothetical protein
MVVSSAMVDKIRSKFEALSPLLQGMRCSEDKKDKSSCIFSSNYNHNAFPLTSDEVPGRATGATTPIRTATAAQGDGPHAGGLHCRRGARGS